MGCFPMFRNGLQTCIYSDSSIVSTLSDGEYNLVGTGADTHGCGETNFQVSTKLQSVLDFLAAFMMEGIESLATYGYGVPRSS